MKWFGPNPWSRLFERVETPVGKPCLYCNAAITADDRGVAMPFHKVIPEIGDPVMFADPCGGAVVKGTVQAIEFAATRMRFVVRPDQRPEGDDTEWTWNVPDDRLIIVATDCVVHRVCLLAALGVVS